MNIIDCDNCYYSEFAGYSHIVNSKEYCLKFNKELRINDNNTSPCEECKGKYFRLDD